MAVNIFEGARRIAVLLAGGAAAITVLVAFNEDASYRAQYSLAGPNMPFIKTEGDCHIQGKTIYFDYKTSDNKEIGVALCLEPMTFTNKNKEESELIPFKTDDAGMTWGAQPYSDEVSGYVERVKQRFTMSATDESAVIKLGEKQWRIELAETMGFLLVGLAVFGALVWSIDWIVRGFLGIPRGMDKRPEM